MVETDPDHALQASLTRPAETGTLTTPWMDTDHARTVDWKLKQVSQVNVRLEMNGQGQVRLHFELLRETQP